MFFTGKVVLITGASSGIGEELARQLSKEGARLVLCARRRELLEKLARELGGQILVQECDVTRDGDIEKVVEATRAKWGRLDVVFANAGFGVAGSLDALKLEDYRRQFETNVFGLLRTIYGTLSDLEKTQGSLVLIGSVAGWVALPGSSPYAMSKFAVRALANSIAEELRPKGVTVTLISPGFVESEIRKVDNQGKHHASAPDPIPPFLRVPTDKAVREIIRAVAKRKRERIVTGHGKVIVRLQRFVPWVIQLMAARGMRGRAQPKGT
jgi:short-subunit dehydrogenase